MHIDDRGRIMSNEAGSQDLHIACKHYQLNPVLLEEPKLSRLSLVSCCSAYRDVFERDSIVSRELFHLPMIRDNHSNIAVQFPRLPAVQQIRHTVKILRAEESHSRRQVHDTDLPVHLQLFRNPGE
jgi:hypothetical protein